MVLISLTDWAEDILLSLRFNKLLVLSLHKEDYFPICQCLSLQSKKRIIFQFVIVCSWLYAVVGSRKDRPVNRLLTMQSMRAWPQLSKYRSRSHKWYSIHCVHDGHVYKTYIRTFINSFDSHYHDGEFSWSKIEVPRDVRNSKGP